MATQADALNTIGDIKRNPQFARFTKRQIEYAIDSLGIEPVARFGIIRAFSDAQLPLILSAVRRTARRYVV